MKNTMTTPWWKAKKCTTFRCKNLPNPSNYINTTFGTYYYCDKCWPHIKWGIETGLGAK